MIPAFQNARARQGSPYAPLIGAWDLDPSRWIPIKYAMTTDLDFRIADPPRVILPEGRTKDFAVVTIVTDPERALITHLTHGILDRCVTQSTAATPPRNDGQYEIDFSDETNNYTPIPVQAQITFGSVLSPPGTFAKGPNVLPFPWPIFCPGRKTFKIRLRNLVDRFEYYPEYNIQFRCFQVCLHGLAERIPIERGERGET